MTEEARPLKHSGFGIASFIISLVVGVAEVISVAIAGIMATSNPSGIYDASSATILGFILIGGFLVNLAGVVFGIVGIFSKNTKNVFAILGLILNLVIILGVVGFMIIGLAIGG